ncbi:hypothetical protein BST61_g6329 [Cercospora zeina]
MFIEGLVLTLLFAIVGFMATKDCRCRQVEENLLGDVDNRIPRVPLQVLTFQKHPELVPYDQNMSYTEKIDLVATAFTPGGRHFITVPRSEDSILPAPLATADGYIVNIYAITVFHQVHCLGLIFRVYLAYTYGEPLPADIHDKHVYHCFDYLRQALMCAGDTALEKFDPGSNVTFGWGVSHVCKDWDALMDMAIEKAKPLDDLEASGEQD